MEGYFPPHKEWNAGSLHSFNDVMKDIMRDYDFVDHEGMPANMMEVIRFCKASLQKKLRDWRCWLKSRYYVEGVPDEVLMKAPDKRVSQVNWEALLKLWETDKKVLEAERNKKNRGEDRATHTLGSKSIARHNQDLREQLREEYTTLGAYIKAHQTKTGEYPDEYTRVMCEKVIATCMERDIVNSSQPSVLSPILDIVYKRHHGGYERGRGLGWCRTLLSNCLSILSNNAPPPPPQPPAGTLGRRRRLLQVSASGGLFPSWLPRRDRRLLQSDNNGYEYSSLVLTVAADGSGNFTGVGDAVAFAPSNSGDRTVIVVRAGVYVENVVIPSDKTNIVFLGDGSGVTVIRGSRSVGDGWTTFRSATLAVSGEGFLARDITFENVAGAAKGQAVALRVNADLAAFYRCAMSGHQDTLYSHSFRQFYRECDVSGTVDFIFGNAAVTFQGCNIIPRLPLRGQYNAITAQGRDDPNMNTGTSIHNCTIVASAELLASNNTGTAVSVKTYLGRPWKPYSRTVFMKTYMGELVDAAGWTEWDGQTGLDTLYYGEYDNGGPGSATDHRVSWPGYHVMGYDDAVDFTVDQLIDGYGWLESTSFPYDDGV